jgi:hypothetical protein
MQETFVKKVQRARQGNVYLIFGGQDHTCRVAWYFIRVEAAKLKAFQKALSAGKIDLASFGEIIKSGYGKEPPHSTIQFMKDNYGYID